MANDAPHALRVYLANIALLTLIACVPHSLRLHLLPTLINPQEQSNLIRDTVAV